MVPVLEFVTVAVPLAVMPAATSPAVPGDSAEIAHVSGGRIDAEACSAGAGAGDKAVIGHLGVVGNLDAISERWDR